MKVLRLFTFTLLFVAGCSAFPGLRVLTGEDSGDTSAIEAAEAADLVMADKIGASDPSLMAAANRIEAASNIIDIIEIRKDTTNDVLVVSMLFPPENAVPQTQEAFISYYSALQRAHELTWQGTLSESHDVGMLQVNLIAAQTISTLDADIGDSFIGIIFGQSEIERGAAIDYLSGDSRTLDKFLDLIVTGTLSYEAPEGIGLYEGEPNHPLFMLDEITQPAST